jgi:hypothetical protein
MNTRMKIALGCYSVYFLVYSVIGVVYFFSTKIMPYHETVLGTSWEQVVPRFQILFLSSLNLIGVLTFCTCLAGFILLLIPFRKGEIWVKWTIPVMCLPTAFFSTYLTLIFHSNYMASTPWLLLLIIDFIFIVGFLLSIIKQKQTS